MKDLIAGLVLVGGAALGRSRGGLSGFSGVVDDAIKSKMRESRNQTHEIVVGKYTMMFEPSHRGYITAWVMRGWPGFDEARQMYWSGEWNSIIATALEVPVKYVQLGFHSGAFDVRPF